MPEPVIALYRPHPGKEEALLNLVRMHHGVLLDEGLATDEHPQVLKSQNGTLLEIFEWKDAEAVQAAHSNPAVLALWDAFSAVCDFVPLSSLPEAERPFPHFERVDA
ncbi:MAG: hypothetical protein H6830_10455 [Planctomycetes bacterium]|nr:hypothetical protein [Planctomycetota bacterium]MCB9909534.1 hypothetical protein [Planctomycetota bacterium]MCB9912499.1 hypothetical protein [Planctomycetota bacterium]HPF15433.1 hypothetical protein [Planctomycetota bacterium]HRV82327.1 hypothetical protein [Planctomycetota bacterium]